MGAVLVHIDLDGQRPHPSSLAALAAGRAIASSWGATLYAALVATEGTTGIQRIQTILARAGADKVVVARTDVPIAPLWSSIGNAWQGVLDHLRPRVVLFGADSPSGAELGPRTGAKLGARILMRARATGIEEVELRDRDGGYVRASDTGAAVAMIGGVHPPLAGAEDVDLVVLALPGGSDTRVELVGTAAAEVMHTRGVMVVIGDEAATDPAIARDALRLAALLGAPLVGGAGAERAGAVAAGAVIERGTALAPDVCVMIGAITFDLAGASSLVNIGPSSTAKGADGALSGPIGTSLADLCRVLGGS